jgi:hypothetical protein
MAVVNRYFTEKGGVTIPAQTNPAGWMLNVTGANAYHPCAPRKSLLHRDLRVHPSLPPLEYLHHQGFIVWCSGGKFHPHEERDYSAVYDGSDLKM